MNYKYPLTAVFVVLVLAVGWFFALPMLAANSLGNALRDNDVIGINAAVDFPSLRENLRGTIGGAIGQQTSNQDFITQLGTAFAGSLLSGVLEQLVTPAGLASLYQGGTGTLSGMPSNDLRISNGLLGFDRFGITVNDLKNPKNSLTFVLMPRGLQWKLVGIQFSPTAFK